MREHHTKKTDKKQTIRGTEQRGLPLSILPTSCQCARIDIA